MNSGYYQAGPKRSERVRLLFSRIASRYDLINDIQSAGLHRLWKRRMVRAAGLGREERALDVCCGTGDIALRLAESAGEVAACDFTPEMLAAGRLRSASNVTWVQGDALALPFANEAFHAVTIGYGLRNLADLHIGVKELLRVLAPGGRLLILEFGKPPNPVLRTLYFAYLRVVVPLFGLAFCGDPAAYSYILDSLRHYPAQEGVSRALLEAGCRQVEVINFLGGSMSLHIALKA